jgi:hypothetical protein
MKNFMIVQISFLFYNFILIMSNIFFDSVKSNEFEYSDKLGSTDLGSTDKPEPLNGLNDLTRMAYQNKSSDIPLRNSSMTDRFESDTFINHKESFEQNNSRINSMNDEIRELKDKLRVVYEKDEKIQSLQNEFNDITFEVESLRPLQDKCRILTDENHSLQNDLDLLRIQEQNFHKMNDENILLKKKLVEMTKEKESNNSYDLDDLDKSDDLNDLNDSHNENMIPINIPELKLILNERLKSYHEKHIEKLIDDYGLQNKNKIDETTMKKLLLESIHLK